MVNSYPCRRSKQGRCACEGVKFGEARPSAKHGVRDVKHFKRLPNQGNGAAYRKLPISQYTVCRYEIHNRHVGNGNSEMMDHVGLLWALHGGITAVFDFFGRIVASVSLQYQPSVTIYHAWLALQASKKYNLSVYRVHICTCISVSLDAVRAP